MWSNINLSSIQDFASKQVQQVTEVGSSLVNTASESLRKISSDKDCGDGEVNQPNDTCPTINNTDNTSETIKNVTIKADQIADSFFTYASSFAGQALNTTQNVVNQTRVLATKANEKANEAVAQLSENQTFKDTLNQVQSKIDATIIGDFNNFQKSFIEKKDSTNDCALPWEGYENSYELKDKILQLSMDKRTFVRSPPAGILFNFNYSDFSSVALKLLEKDSNLNKMRFDLVPKKMKEEIFWKNYFYRVSLVKQSYQIKSLQRSNSNSKTSLETTELSDLPGTTPSTKDKERKESTTFHDVNIDDNFASNDFNEEITATDLEAEMAALGMAGDGGADWEKELEAELDEYEILDQETPKETNKANSLKDDSSWEKEMDDMLN